MPSHAAGQDADERWTAHADGKGRVCSLPASAVPGNTCFESPWPEMRGEISCDLIHEQMAPPPERLYIALLDIPGSPVTTLGLIVPMAHARLKAAWSKGGDLYFGFCHEYVWEGVLILDFPFLLVSGESIRDEGMWEGFRIWISEHPCARRLDILCGPIWTSQHCLDVGTEAGWHSQDPVGAP